MLAAKGKGYPGRDGMLAGKRRDAIPSLQGGVGFQEGLLRCGDEGGGVAVEAGEVAAGEQKEGEDLGAYGRRAQREVGRGLKCRYQVGCDVDKRVDVAVGNPCGMGRTEATVEGCGPVDRLLRIMQCMCVGPALRCCGRVPQPVWISNVDERSHS